MSKSLKLENDNYLDSQSVTHNRELLSVILETIKERITDMKETVLYDNPSGSNGTITLSDSAENYTYLEIYYRPNDTNLYQGFTKVYSPNNKYCSLGYPLVTLSGDELYSKYKNIFINSNKITNQDQRYAEVRETRGTVSNSNCIYITRVIGYK